MAIDAMIDRFRATGCAYAIDGKQGGRILSPLQQVDYRDFAANPQDWGTSWADAIGASDGWEVDVAARCYTESASTLIFGRGTGSFMMQTTASGVLCGFFCVDLQATSTWTVESAFTNKVIPVVWPTLVGVTIKREIFPIGEFHAFKLVRGDGFLSLYFDDALVATCNCTLIDNKPFNSLTNDGNIQSITLKNSTGTTVWQAPQSELYTGWLLKPLAPVAGGATFELKQGLLAFDGDVTTDTAGNFVSSSAGNRLYVPINLAGYTGSFSLLWDGDLTAYQTLFIQGPGDYVSSVRLWGTQESFSFSIGNGSVGIQANTQNIQLGKHFIVCVVDRDAKEISLYMDGVLVKSNSIPDDFGAVVPSATESQFGVTTSTYLSRFAFWNRALSAEEVAAL